MSIHRAVRAGLVLLLAASAAVSAEAASRRKAAKPAPPPQPVTAQTSAPQWDRKPGGRELARLYPPLAQLLGANGAATIMCGVTVTGSMGDCRVVKESPLGLGFGEATLLASGAFHLKPRIVDGKPIAGAVMVPLRWQLAPASGPATGAAPSPEPAPRALALARRIVAGMGMVDAVTDELDRDARARVQLAVMGGAPAPSANEAQVVFDLLHQAYAAEAARVVDERAMAYAVDLTESQLNAIAKFVESPAGRAMIAEQKKTGALPAADVQRLLDQGGASARTSFCERTACAEPAPAAPIATAPRG